MTQEPGLNLNLADIRAAIRCLRVTACFCYWTEDADAYRLLADASIELGHIEDRARYAMERMLMQGGAP